ncbi:hypothetical protein MRX96_047173 [Rhipicephalus microplus]
MVSALDKSVGKIFKALHEREMLNDTFLSFSSDNGAAATYWGTDVASSYPLRGEKIYPLGRWRTCTGVHMDCAVNVERTRISI